MHSLQLALSCRITHHAQWSWVQIMDLQCPCVFGCMGFNSCVLLHVEQIKKHALFGSHFLLSLSGAGLLCGSIVALTQRLSHGCRKVLQRLP
jgi:hypothetical protein